MYIASPEMPAHSPAAPARSSPRQDRDTAPDSFAALVESKTATERPSAPASENPPARHSNARAVATETHPAARQPSDDLTADRTEPEQSLAAPPAEAVDCGQVQTAVTAPKPADAEAATDLADSAIAATGDTAARTDPSAVVTAAIINVTAITPPPATAAANIAPADAAAATPTVEATSPRSDPALGAQMGEAVADGPAGSATASVPQADTELLVAAATAERPGKAATNAPGAAPAAAASAAAAPVTAAAAEPSSEATSPAPTPVAAGETKLGAGSAAAAAPQVAELQPDAADPTTASRASTHAPHEPAAPLTAAGADQLSPPMPQPAPPSGAAAPAAAHIKVAVATNAPVPIQAVAMEIAAMAQGGASRFEIRLDPAELGRIDVRIEISKNGQVTSHLTVEKPETLAMLRLDSPQLQRALDDAGLKSGDGGLQFSLRDQSGQNTGGDQRRAQHAQRLILSDHETMPAPIVGRSYGRMLGSASGVDIRV